MKKRNGKRIGLDSCGNALKDALYWQKRYLELQADCKDLFSAVANLCLDRGTDKEPILLEFNEPHGYPSSVLSMLRDSGIWTLVKRKHEAKSDAETKHEA